MKTVPKIIPDRSDFLLNLAVFVAYTAAGKFGLSFATLTPSASAVWPPTGLGLAASLLYGSKVTPAIFFGAFLVNVTTSGDIFTSILIALGNTLEAYVGAMLINKYALGKRFVDQTVTIFKFLTIETFCAVPLSATIGVASLFLMGFIPSNHVSTVWLTWWLGDLGGAYIVTPFLLFWSKRFRAYRSIPELMKISILFTCLIVSTSVIFSPLTKDEPLFSLTFLPLPFLYWISYVTNPQLTALAVIINTGIAITGTHLGFGRFIAESPNLTQIILQFYLNIIAVSTLIFSASVHEKNKIDRRYRSLIDRSFDVIALIDEQANILFSSKSAERILGFKTEELNNTNGLDLIHPEDLPETQKKLVELLHLPGGSVSAQYRLRRKDNHWVWVEATGTNLLGDPDVRAIVINYRDITDRKTAQDLLKKNQIIIKDERDRLHTIIRSIADGVIVTDKNFRVTIINEAACRLLNCSENFAIGKNIADIATLLKDNTVVPRDARYYHKAFETGKPIITQLQDNYYYKTRIGKTFPIILSVAPLFDNETTGVVNVFRDVTEIKELDKAKSDFLSIAAHQLRTPLGINRWHFEMLLKGDYGKIEPKAAGVVQKMYDNNSRLISLVSDLLNVSRIDQHKAANNPEPINIDTMLKINIEEIQDNAKEHSVQLVYESGIDQNFKITLDPVRFHVVIQNILANAIKYSLPDSTVNLYAAREKDQLVITCRDSGIGIPDEALDKIFTKFYRAPNAVLHDSDGSGLGLYVVKSYVEDWKGKLDIKSKVGKGTKLTISIPIGQTVRTSTKL